MLDMSGATAIVAKGIYIVLFLFAMWGGFNVIMVWLRVGQKRFRSEDEQVQFLKELQPMMAGREFKAATELLDGDSRAISQLSLLALNNRELGYERVRQLLMDRFQRDVLADLEHRLSWVQTVIKSAPMVGLFGTVMGMMGAFGKLAGKENVNPDVLAGDISIALITTAAGLAIAIPLVLCIASINIRIRDLEYLVAVGLAQFLEMFRASGAGSET
jgi:biopolymer transport protein ExbB